AAGAAAASARAANEADSHPNVLRRVMLSSWAFLGASGGKLSAQADEASRGFAAAKSPAIGRGAGAPSPLRGEGGEGVQAQCAWPALRCPLLGELRRHHLLVGRLPLEDADVASKLAHAGDELARDGRIVIRPVAADQLGDQLRLGRREQLLADA